MSICDNCENHDDCERWGTLLPDDRKQCRDFKGHIEFQKKGVLTLYRCTCGLDQTEPDDLGVTCHGCGATRSWED